MTTAITPVPAAITRDGRPLVPQPHGGALARYQPGHVSTGGFRKVRRDALAILREGTVEASRRLLELTRSSDERVAIMALVQVLDRTMGKPSDMPQGADSDGGPLDLSLLDAGEREELLIHLAGIRRLRDLVASRTATQERG